MSQFICYCFITFINFLFLCPGFGIIFLFQTNLIYMKRVHCFCRMALLLLFGSLAIPIFATPLRPVVELLRHDGTLNLSTGWSGSLNISGFSVHFDALRGPVFAPATETWSPLGDGLNGACYAIAVNGNTVFAGGNFTMAGGIFANRIARWDGANWTALGNGLNGPVYALAIFGNDILAGGNFTKSGTVDMNRIARWIGAAWNPIGIGLNSTCYALLVRGMDIYAGGTFTTAGGIPANFIARSTGTSWAALGLGLNDPCYALTTLGSNNEIIAGGSFTTAGTVAANRVARWNVTNSSWNALGSGLNETCYALATQSVNTLFAGGKFTTAGGNPANYVARWNGTNWFPLGAGLNDVCLALAANGSYVFAGGTFTTAGGNPAKKMARWNGSAWIDLADGLNDDCYALTFLGTSVVAGGRFTEADMEPAARIAVTVGCEPPVLDTSTKKETCHNIPASGTVFKTTPPNATVYWTNDLPLIGLPPTGFGNIPSVTAPNTRDIPLVATIYPTPVSEPMYAYVTNNIANNVSIVNLSNNAVVTNIPLPSGPRGVAVSPNNALVLIVSQGTRQVTIMDARTNTIRSTIIVGSGNTSQPYGVAVNHTGTRAYVTNRVTNNVTAFDPVINAVYANIPVGMAPGGIAIAPDSNTVYVANEGSDNVSKIDPETNTVTATIPVGDMPLGVAVWSAGKRVYVTNAGGNSVSVINAEADTVIATIPLMSRPSGLAVSVDGTRLYVATGNGNLMVINTATNAIVTTTAVGPSPVGVSVSPDGSRVVVAHAGTSSVFPGVRIVSTTTNAVVGQVDFPSGTGTFSLGNFINPGSCFGTPKPFKIQINPKTVVDLGKDTTICPGQSVKLIAAGTGISFLWSPTPIPLPAQNVSRSITVKPTATTSAYIVSAQNRFGCETNDTLKVTIHQSKPMVCREQFAVYLNENGIFPLQPGFFIGDTIRTPQFYQYTVRDQNGTFLGDTLTCTQLDQLVTITIRDICSKQQCVSKVIVFDTVPPRLQCRNVFVRCALPSYDPFYLRDSFSIADAIPGVDNCKDFSVTWTDGAIISRACTFTAKDSLNRDRSVSATFTRTWNFRDSSGNTASCVQNIHVERTRIWDIVFPKDTAVRCDWSESQFADKNFNPYIRFNGRRIPLFLSSPATQYCGPQFLYTEQIFPETDGTYSILRKWVLTDPCLPIGSGSTPVPYTNPRFGVQIIEVTPDNGLSAQCPKNFTVSTKWDTCCAPVDLPDIILSDACGRAVGISATVVTIDPASGDTTGIYAVPGRLMDFPGNNYWVTDTMGTVGITPCLHPGTHEVTYNINNDRLANLQCRFKVTVANLNPPKAICQNPVIVSLGHDDLNDCYFPQPDSMRFAGVGWLKARSLDDSSIDRCGAHLKFTARRVTPYSGFIQNLSRQACVTGTPSEYERATAEQDSIKFYCHEIGNSIMVALRVYRLDYNGQPELDHNGEAIYGECMTVVSVQDKLAPQCRPPAPVTISCENFDPGLTAYGSPEVWDNCCIATKTVSANYGLFDTVCNRGTILRIFYAQDCSGHSDFCNQRIVVTHDQSYYVRFPDDRVLNGCNAPVPVSPPVFFGEDCEALAFSFRDDTLSSSPDACFTLHRNWKVINWCTYDPNKGYLEIPNPQPNAILLHAENLTGPIVSAPGAPSPWSPSVVKLMPGSQVPLDYSTLWTAEVNGYSYQQLIYVVDAEPPVIKCTPADSCDFTANDTLLWVAPRFLDRRLHRHDLCEGLVNLSVNATDACTGANIQFRYRLFLDLDGDGAPETVVNSQNLPDAGTVRFGNIVNPNYLYGIAQPFDLRNVPLDQRYQFAIQTTVSGQQVLASLRWNTAAAPNTYFVPELPYGKHRIEWLVSDGCGNETVCSQPFVIKDCKKPTVVCKSLTVSLSYTAIVGLWASDFLEYGTDNCTPADSLKYWVVNEVKSSGNPPGDTTMLFFNCADKGIHLINLWAMDLAGNADFCATYVLIQDNLIICSKKASIIGMLRTEKAEGVENGNVQFSGQHPAFPPVKLYQTSDKKGQYAFSNAIPYLGAYRVLPLKNDDPLNGVTTLDLALISQHILNITPLNSPYKMIAADANRSGTITTLDIVTLRRLILGISDTFTNNQSWRFVPRFYVFPNPVNPFAKPFPEDIRVDSLLYGLDTFENNFVSIKTGDVNDSAMANSLLPAEDRGTRNLFFDVPERIFHAGDTFSVPVRAQQAGVGFQFTLEHPGLELIDLSPTLPMQPDHFAVFGQEAALTVAFETELPAAHAQFVLHFRAISAGKLSTALRISDKITFAEGFQNIDYQILKPSVRFSDTHKNTPLVPSGFDLLPCEPNPFAQQTRIPFFLSAPGRVTLAVSDASGRVLSRQNGYFSAGRQSFVLARTAEMLPGMLFIRVVSEVGSGYGKVRVQ